MTKKEVMVEEIEKIMENLDQVRNIAIVAHVDHGKTTLSDSLVARAGLISKQLAGQQRVLDFEEQEQKRGITIKSADISLGFHYEGKDYLINLIDTPGHVDFGGHVTRAMRAVDGVVLVVDAVEGIMPQTETVLRQALKERAKPVVFINKVDRLINELRLSSEDMMKKLAKVIAGINKIISANAPAEYKKDWLVSVENGKVAIGSAFQKWAISIDSMKKSGITFQKIYELVQQEAKDELVKVAPVDEVILQMVVKNLPDPKTAQAYRIPVLWRGDLESEEGKAMRACDANGPAIGVVFGVVSDEHAGEVAVVRFFSGKVVKGDQLYQASKLKYGRVQQVSVYMGPDRVQAEKITAGNIGALVGLKDIYVGETISSKPIEPFEQIKHYSEPVVTKSIEAVNPKDLGKLIEVLRGISKEDPTLKVELNQETGEHLIRGMGELHLEIVEYKIQEEKGIKIKTSPPIVVYRETLTGNGPVIEGKSPNKHNKFYIKVEKLPDNMVELIEEGKIPVGRVKGKVSQNIVDELMNAGMDREEAKGLWDVYGTNIFIDATKGVQYLNEVQELVLQAFEEAMKKGPLAQELVSGVKVTLLDATLHEDNVHRGPAQIIPAVKRPIYASMLKAGVLLLEPKQKILIQVPHDYSGAVLNLVNGKRGRLLGMEQDGDLTKIEVVVPVSETFGFSNDIRSASQGRAIWYSEYFGYEQLPRDLIQKVVSQIRERKGIPVEPPKAEDFME
ncbi:MAG: elongation factor EF-2 [Methanobacteriota archaeon]|nr:MAG: elongation factor EF-2 [Euryarchaeota archaeon]